ncbi:hypothetical protein DXG03_008680 [Asterophora parasitica]|uniref:SH3 domain-containing protein n=1 Tax=Asterophora parasitica TaxID=117018 RepID=A0A9P7GC46_9AGAR|nr:hypothetical protein DXG03_008680 [Asterophora parasitica]
MHFARQHSKHAHLGRDVAHENRALIKLPISIPPLIKLPISIPPIPIIGPLLTPIIQGKSTPTPTPAPAPAPTPTPIPTVIQPTLLPPPVTLSPSDGGNGNNGNGNGNNGNGNNGNGNNGNGNNGNGNNGNGNNGRMEMVVARAMETRMGMGVGEETAAALLEMALVAPVAATLAALLVEADSGNGDGSETGGSNTGPLNGNGKNLAANPNGNSPVGNAGSNPNQFDNQPDVEHPSLDSTGGNGGGFQSASATRSGAGGPTPTSLSDPSKPDGSGGAGELPPHSSKGISPGAIAGIAVVVSLIFLALLIFLLRKRYMSRRSHRRNQWWGGASHAYDIRDGVPSRSRNRSSVRSSFATTVDQSQASRLTVDLGDAPPVPSMTEVSAANGSRLISPAAATAVLVSFDNSHLYSGASNRTSLRSLDSNNSESQSLVFNNDVFGERTMTSMSVRPFSPSESFAFPKPPSKQSGDWTSSRPVSAVTATSAVRSYASDPIPPIPALPKDPFADPSQSSTELDKVEIILRPFISTRPDELSVGISDRIRVKGIFDDGWALVERLPSSDTSAAGVTGLIPIDCFRAPGQDLSSFVSDRSINVPSQEDLNVNVVATA